MRIRTGIAYTEYFREREREIEKWREGGGVNRDKEHQRDRKGEWRKSVRLKVRERD